MNAAVTPKKSRNKDIPPLLYTSRRRAQRRDKQNFKLCNTLKTLYYMLKCHLSLNIITKTKIYIQRIILFSIRHNRFEYHENNTAEKIVFSRKLLSR